MEIDKIHNETATLKLIQNEWKNKEKRLAIAKGTVYRNLPKIEDESLVVLEKTVPGYAESIHGKAFEA
jgi:CTP-dependent riboflavin kinase